MESFLEIVRLEKDLGKKELADILGYTQQRVNYLCSNRCKGFPYHELVKLKDKLGISTKTMLKLIEQHLFSE